MSKNQLATRTETVTIFNGGVIVNGKKVSEQKNIEMAIHDKPPGKIIIGS